MDRLQRRVYYLHTDRNAALIAWLDRQRNTGQTVRRALRLLQRQEQGQNGRLDAELIESAVTRAVERALAGLSLISSASEPGRGGGESEEATSLIDDLLNQF